MRTDEPTFRADAFAYDPATGFITRKGRRVGSSSQGHGCRYRRVSLGFNRVLEHRLAWRLMTGEWPAHQVDHRNGNTQDNCWQNLRAATKSDNQCNVAVRPGFSGERGAYLDTANNRWVVIVNREGLRYQGRASHSISAICAARLIRRVLHGEFAIENRQAA